MTYSIIGVGGGEEATAFKSHWTKVVCRRRMYPNIVERRCPRLFTIRIYPFGIRANFSRNVTKNILSRVWTWTVSMLANFAPRFQQFSKLFHERFVTILIIVRYDMFHAYKNFDEKVEKIETMLSRGRTSSNNLKSSSENP